MSLKKMRANITFSEYMMEYLDDLANRLEGNRSETVSACIFYVSANEEDFIEFLGIGTEDEEEDEEEE